MALAATTAEPLATSPIVAGPIRGEFDSIIAYVNELIHNDGTLAMTGDLVLNKGNPAVILEGEEASGVHWRIREAVDTGVSHLYLEHLDGASWVTALKIPYAPTTDVKAVLSAGLSLGGDKPKLILDGTETSHVPFSLQEDTGELILKRSTTEILRVHDDNKVEIPGTLTVGTPLTVTDLVVSNTISVGASGIPFSAIKTQLLIDETLTFTPSPPSNPFSKITSFVSMPTVYRAYVWEISYWSNLNVVTSVTLEVWYTPSHQAVGRITGIAANPALPVSFHLKLWLLLN